MVESDSADETECLMKYVLFWVLTDVWGKTYWSHFQGSNSSRRRWHGYVVPKRRWETIFLRYVKYKKNTDLISTTAEA